MSRLFGNVRNPVLVRLSFWAVIFLALPERVRAIDCNGNGIADRIEVQSGASVDCNRDGVPDECEVFPFTFGATPGIPVEGSPHRVVAADMDGDGDLDLITAVLEFDTRFGIAVLINQGSREFSAMPSVGAGVQLAGLAAGDVDGDEYSDVVALNATHVLVYENLSDGTLEERQRIAVPAGQDSETRGLDSILLADLDGDGLDEIVVVYSTVDKLGVHWNEGERFANPVQFDVGWHPTSVAAGDFDKNGFVDLAVSNTNSADVSLLFGNGVRSFEIGGSIKVGDEGSVWIAARELNDDDSLDLLVRNRTTLSRLSNDGSGHFTEVMTLADRSALVSSAAEDFDGDGDVDVAVGRADRSLLIRINDGFGFDINVPFPLDFVPRSMISGDFDGDGGADLVLTGNSRSINFLWNDRDFDVEPYDILEVHDIHARPHAIALSDVDGDDDLDVVSGNNRPDRGLTVLFNDGLGNFSDGVDFVTSGSPFSIVMRDFDRDGDEDVASASFRTNEVELLRNNGSGGFESHPVRNEVGGGPFHISAGDLDGDGMNDVVTSNFSSNSVSVLFMAGDFGLDEAPFGLRLDFGDQSSPLATALADFDGNGLIDIAVANSGQQRTLIFYMNLGNRTFLEQAQVLNLASRPSFVATEDLDGDGSFDLAIVNSEAQFGRDVSLFWNDGHGGFPTIASNISLMGQKPYSLVAVDIDGNGLSDLVTANQQSHSFTVLLNGGARSFLPPERDGHDVSRPEDPANPLPIFVIPGDLDSDGDADLVSANHGSESISIISNLIPEAKGEYLTEVCTLEDFFDISLATHSGNVTERVTKYFVPVPDKPALLPTMFQNVKIWPFHLEFLRDVFDHVFPALTSTDFNQLVGRRDTREYYIGSLTRVRSLDGFVYVFDAIPDTAFGFDEVLNEEEVGWVHDSLAEAFQLRPLAYRPDTELARREAATWHDPPFEVFADEGTFGDLEYEAYTVGPGYGHVHVLDLDEFERLNRVGLFTFQDILVIAEAPRDIEGVVGGVVTAKRQGGLSHIAIRTARRGTPNCHIKGALELFEGFEGKVVRLEVFATEYFVTEVSQEEAEDFWVTNRPRLSDLPDVDGAYAGLDSMNEIDLAMLTPEARYGGKATYFARLQETLTGDLVQYREPGFSIPARYYVEFMQSNFANVDGEDINFQKFLDRILASPSFQADPVARAESLARFRDYVRDTGVVDLELVSALVDRIPEVFGSSATMVRFRSSANVEDALEFSGAGLYESTSVCALDETDRDSLGPSLCDPSHDEERTIQRALKKVWSSLWTFRAHEERTYFQIPPESAAMALLVTRAVLDESANGVAFTGNPLNPQDDRYVVTAQAGEESVVSPRPGTSVERNLLEIENGQVVAIVRDRSSSLLDPGETVLSNGHLRELGELMFHINESFPIDLQGHDRSNVLLDFEYKIGADGSLSIKQVRPFLIPSSILKTPTFELVVPPNTVLCGVFSPNDPGRPTRDLLEFKSTIRLREGAFELPTDRDSFEVDLVGELVFSPQQLPAVPNGVGRIRLHRIPDSGSHTDYEFEYEQEFTVAGAEIVRIRIAGLKFRGRREFPVEKTIVIDETFITASVLPDVETGLSIVASIRGRPVAYYSSCSYSRLPLWWTELSVRAGDDDTLSAIRLEERFLPPPTIRDTGPASLVRAEVSLEGQQQTVDDYWRLVYSARRHNKEITYWVVLDPPLTLSIAQRPVHVIQVSLESFDSDSPLVSYLDENYQFLGSRSVDPESFVRRVGEARFLRGDSTSDGSVDVSDVVQILAFLFQGGVEPPCEKAFDTDDSGRVDIADPLRLALHLFGTNIVLPQPAGRCDQDPSADDLTCDFYPDSSCGR